MAAVVYWLERLTTMRGVPGLILAYAIGLTSGRARSMKCYIAPVKSPFAGGTVRAKIKMGLGHVESNPY